MFSALQIRHVAAAMLAATLVLVTACATVPAPERGIVDTGTLNDDEGIVFGMLVPQYYNAGGKHLTGGAVPELPYELYFGTAESLNIKRVFSGFTESIAGNAQEPRTFFAMKLPAGEYSIFKLHRPLGRSTGVVTTDVRFTVSPDKATYVGSLQIDFRAAPGMLGAEIVGKKVALKVVDDTPEATQVYKQRNPAAKQPIVTSLMKVRRQ
jgi:hypothetical protein